MEQTTGIETVVCGIGVTSQLLKTEAGGGKGGKRGTPCVGRAKEVFALSGLPWTACPALQDSAALFYQSHLPQEGK